jgi:hypothetical protein
VRALITLVAILLAVTVRVTIVDRIAFPGGAWPGLVLIVVAALAGATGSRSSAGSRSGAATHAMRGPR